MRRSFQNIKLSYLFRHAGNYKAFGFVILKNSDGRIPKEIDADLRRCLIDGAYFYPEQVQLQVLDDGNESIWHEYENVEGGDEYRLKVRTLCAAGRFSIHFSFALLRKNTRTNGCVFCRIGVASLRMRNVRSVYREVFVNGVCTVGVLDTFFLRVAAEKHSN